MSSFQIDDEFAGEVLQHKWCQQEKGHFATKSAGAGKVYLHRFVWGLKHGTVPQIIDHINGDPTDNRLANLRPADFTLNNGNRRMRKPTRCGLPRGVDQVGVRFRARIRESGARVFIGLFDTAEEASAAY
jgi:hypothetical protein